jgi:hypothetical protein
MRRQQDEVEAARRYGGQGAGEEGREQARVEGLRAAVLAFARARLAPLSADDAMAIAALVDERALMELVDTLAHAPCVETARVVLDAAIAGTRR